MDILYLQTVTNNFLKELADARAGKKTSLPFIKHHVALTPHVGENEPFEVLRIGGSIYQKAIVKKVKGKIRILARLQKKLPVLSSEKIFLSFIKDNLDPNVSSLALNFAYPLTPVFRKGLLDGVLVTGTKEHTFAGLVGKPLGETTELYIARETGRRLHVSVANDTVCLLLSGLTKFPWSELVAGVVGTGLNFATFLDEHTLVNIESAGFNKFAQSPEGKLIDASSALPGEHIFEKEAAGGYLYQHFNLKADTLGLKYKKLGSTKEIDVIANQDIAQISKIAQEVSEQSAALVACQIAGLMLFREKDCTFVIEGSLFWRGWRYKDHVAYYVRRLAPDFQATFVFIDNSGILGAAKLIA